MKKTIILGVFFLLTANAHAEEGVCWEEKTPTYTRQCIDDTCELTLYSGIRQIHEDGKWKLVENANSLLGYYNIIYLEKEDAFNIEVIDFNLHEIELKTTFLGHPLDYPDYCTYKSEKEFKCQFKNNVKWTECSGKENCIEQTIKYDMKYEMKNGKIVANDTKFQYKGNTLDKKYSFGGNSTTIILQDADTENLDDDCTELPGTGSLVFDDDDAPPVYYSYIKFDISTIPANQEILDANVNFYIVQEISESDDIAQVYSVVNEIWEEENGADYSDTGMNFLVTGILQDTFTNLTNETWIDFDVTNDVTIAYAAEDVNESFGLYLVDGSPDAGDDYITVSSKEYATDTTKRPIMNIRYQTASAASTCNPPASGAWNIENGDACTIDDRNVMACDIHIVNGSLTITSSGEVIVPQGCKVIVTPGEMLAIEKGGKLTIAN